MSVCEHGVKIEVELCPAEIRREFIGQEVRMTGCRECVLQAALMTLFQHAHTQRGPHGAQ